MGKELVNYDTYNYDYSTYWEGREYEHQAEVALLEKYFKGVKGKSFIDIGGSYGRLLPTYVNLYNRVVILDYSIRTLQNSYNFLTKRETEVIPIAANIYNIPFHNNTFDGGSMIRVLHHLDNQKQYFSELSRVLSYDANFVQEIPNKIHLKWRLTRLLQGNFTQYHEKPSQQAFIAGSEGAKGEAVTFLNYHPNHIESLLKEYNFDILEKRGCSFLRSTPIKEFLGNDTSLKLERFLQKTLKGTNLTPSIIYKATNKTGKNLVQADNLVDILACPICKSNLQQIDKNTLFCNKCDKHYQRLSGVWDFRT